MTWIGFNYLLLNYKLFSSDLKHLASTNASQTKINNSKQLKNFLAPCIDQITAAKVLRFILYSLAINNETIFHILLKTNVL